ncbi:adenine phosphoribosyltransferase [candidate division KSB1 bacterium]|nr:adenine phosphoribosyltransferase [candidate division KSB1 bacterium]
MKKLIDYIRCIPDFPKKGINFKDITTLLKDGKAFSESVNQLAEPYLNDSINAVVGIEARGFIFAAAVAYRLGVGMIPVRKPGKLPTETICEEYELEYGTDGVEVHKDAIQPGQRILIVDDLLATGGTALATCKLVEKLGGKIRGVRFLIELDFLNGREKLGNYPVSALIHYLF